MKFAVCITPVMDTSAPTDFMAVLTAQQLSTSLQSISPPLILNPADEAAAWFVCDLRRPDEAALAIHVGGLDGDPALREAMAITGGDAIRLELSDGQLPSAPIVAEALGQALATQGVDWVFCGQATLDWGSGIVAPSVAELLGMALVDHVLEVTRQNDGSLHCVRLVSKGEREEVSVTPPALIAVSPLAYRTRTVSVPQKLRARRVPISLQSAVLALLVPKSTRQEARRPLPRPKDALPADFSALSAADRVSAMMQTIRPPASTASTLIEGDPEKIAIQLLDYIEASGHNWQAIRRRQRAQTDGDAGLE